jgi:hypothetical protein
MSPRLLRPLASGVHPEAAAWRSAVVANGGSVSSSTVKAVSTFCAAIDAAGIRDRFYRLNLFAGTGLNAALVPVYRGPSLGGTQYGNTTDTNVGPFVSGDYAETGASGGLVGNGSSKYLNTGLASNSLPSITSGHLSVYMRSNSISATQGLIGADDSVNRFAFFLRPSQILRGTWAEITNSTANNETTSFTTYPTNLYTFTRTAAAESVIYAGATASNTNTVSASPTAISTPWFVFAANNNSSAANFSSARFSGYSIGTGMSAADMTAYNTAMAAFQTALTRTA